jgi:hypothetical protein
MPAAESAAGIFFLARFFAALRPVHFRFILWDYLSRDRRPMGLAYSMSI